MGRRRHVEAGRSKIADHRVVVSQVGWTGIAPRLHQADGPPVARERLADRDRALVLPAWAEAAGWLFWGVVALAVIAAILNAITPSAGERRTRCRSHW